VLCHRLGQRGIQRGSQRGIHRGYILCLQGRRWLSTKRHADQRLKGLARQSGGEGDAIALAPLCPGQAEAAALIEAMTSACKPHAGRLLLPVIQCARWKETATSALLTWVDATAAGTHKLTSDLILQLIVTVNAALAGLWGTQVGCVQCCRLKPANNVLACSRHLSQ